MPTIYVPNKGAGHDLSAAEKYGQLHFLSDGPMSKYAVSTIYRKFAMQLRESHPDDLILQTGLTMMNCIAVACFVALHQRINLLVYKNNYYVKRTIMLNDLCSTDQDVKEMMP